MLGGSGKFDKNGAVWCILNVPKFVIINLKINIFLIINQQPKFCAIFFSKINKINPDAHFGTKINTFTFYKGDRGWWGGGGNSPQKPKKCKKGGFTFFTANITYRTQRYIL